MFTPCQVAPPSNVSIKVRASPGSETVGGGRPRHAGQIPRRGQRTLPRPLILSESNGAPEIGSRHQCESEKHSCDRFHASSSRNGRPVAALRLAFARHILRSTSGPSKRSAGQLVSSTRQHDAAKIGDDHGGEVTPPLLFQAGYDVFSAGFPEERRTRNWVGDCPKIRLNTRLNFMSDWAFLFFPALHPKAGQHHHRRRPRDCDPGEPGAGVSGPPAGQGSFVGGFGRDLLQGEKRVDPE